jgi:transposase-like protein
VRLLRSSGRPVPQLASELDVSPQSLRNWSAQLDVEQGKADVLTSSEREQLRRLRRKTYAAQALSPSAATVRRALPKRNRRRRRIAGAHEM